LFERAVQQNNGSRKMNPEGAAFEYEVLE
jgi:hypothetical protein